MTTLIRRLAWATAGSAFAASIVAVAILGGAARAPAASLVEVTDFAPNPSHLRMFVYAPVPIGGAPAVVVAMHACHGDGPGFFKASWFAALADRDGFIVIYPSVTGRADGCFDVASPSALRHDGGSDPAGIVAMVRYALAHYHADGTRVFAAGVSSGAMMTNVLLGDYPDVFRAGAAFAGVPFGCFAGPSSWAAECARGGIARSPREWGDLVRAAFPTYAGARPRMQLWHGTNDEVVDLLNLDEEIKQWTDVLAATDAPATVDAPRPGWTRARYADRDGAVVVEAVRMAGVRHDLPVPADAAIHFFGLDGRAASSAAPAAGVDADVYRPRPLWRNR